MSNDNEKRNNPIGHAAEEEKDMRIFAFFTGLVALVLIVFILAQIFGYKAGEAEANNGSAVATSPMAPIHPPASTSSPVRLSKNRRARA